MGDLLMELLGLFIVSALIAGGFVLLLVVLGSLALS